MRVPEHDRKTKRILASGEPYQGNRLARALPLCRQRRFALDVGAHIGMWSVQLANVFGSVVAFEPQPDSFAALCENVAGKAVTTWQCAIGNLDGLAYLDGSALGAHVAPADHVGDIEVEIRTLDSFKFEGVDFMKIDVEGFEAFVLAGGEQTIRRDRPVIVLEQKYSGRYGIAEHAAVSILRKWGAIVEWKIKHDFCMRWK